MRRALRLPLLVGCLLAVNAALTLVGWRAGAVPTTATRASSKLASPRFHDTFPDLSLLGPPAGARLRSRDLVVGDGPCPVRFHAVEVDYTAWLADGTELECSGLRPSPFCYTYGVTMVVKGFDEGLRDMHAGGRRILYVPAPLAYQRQAAPGVPAESDLVFDVRLLSVGDVDDVGSDGGH